MPTPAQGMRGKKKKNTAATKPSQWVERARHHADEAGRFVFAATEYLVSLKDTFEKKVEGEDKEAQEEEIMYFMDRIANALKKADGEAAKAVKVADAAEAKGEDEDAGAGILAQTALASLYEAREAEEEARELVTAFMAERKKKKKEKLKKRRSTSQKKRRKSTKRVKPTAERFVPGASPVAPLWSRIL